MASVCCECGQVGLFSSSQKKKNVWRRKCMDCIGGLGSPYSCLDCPFTAVNENSLRFHRRSHLPKHFACPACKVKFFRGQHEAIAHFVNKCAHVQNAGVRFDVCDFLRSQPAGERYMTVDLASNGLCGECMFCCRFGRQFRCLHRLVRHMVGSLECQPRANPPVLFIGQSSTPMPMRMKLYHGTTLEAADCILREGSFRVSADGRLGAGVYLAQEEKARRFATNKTKNQGQRMAALIEVFVTVRNVKFAVVEDREWHSQGHDACRADCTANSMSMEWCISDPREITIQNVEKWSLEGKRHK